MSRAHDPLKTLRVSRRDREIYHQVVVQQLTQRQVATTHKLSQPRVCNIVHRVARWLSETAPAGLEEIPRPQRLYLAARTYQMKLEYYEQQAKRAFEQSQQESYVSTHDLQEGEDGKLNRIGPGKLQRKNPKPDARFLVAAQKFAQAQVEFDGFSEQGEVEVKNEGRLYEEPERGRVEALDELTRRALAWQAVRGPVEGKSGEGSEEENIANTIQPVIRTLSTCSTDISPTAVAKTTCSDSGLASPLSRKRAELTEAVPEKVIAPPVKNLEALSTAATVADPGSNRRQKEPPPTPPGYHRYGDECRPIPSLLSKVERNPRSLPGLIVNRPRLYWLDPRQNVWVPVA